jgi:transcriptional regulator with XRE-family HTH domain
MKFQRIQDLRTDADLSQKQLSEILHISQRSYSHYETGSRNIPVEMLIRLANYYDISVDYLVGRTDKKEMNKKQKGFL